MVRDGLIATFFYARAIKLPLLPLMIDYFGCFISLYFSGGLCSEQVDRIYLMVETEELKSSFEKVDCAQSLIGNRLSKEGETIPCLPMCGG